MKKFLFGVLITLLAIAAITIISEPKANAGWPGGTVYDKKGNTVTVKMDGGKYYTLVEGWHSTRWGRDANQFRPNHDWRCVNVNSKWYKVKPGHFFKIGNFQDIVVSAYTYSWCGRKPWLSTRLQRV